MTAGLVDPNLREAVYDLKVAAEMFLAKRPGGRRPEYAQLPADTDPQEFLTDFVAVMGELWTDETVTRYDLEHIFFNAERAAGPAAGSVTEAQRIIYKTWDRLLEMMPQPDYEDMEGSAAEVSGDYGRMYFPRRIRD